MNWGLEDVIIFSALIAGVIFALWVALKFMVKSFFRTLVVLAVLGIAFLIWLELAVGIFS